MSAQRGPGRPRAEVPTGAVACRLPREVIARIHEEAADCGQPLATLVAEAIQRGRPDWWFRPVIRISAPRAILSKRGADEAG